MSSTPSSRPNASQSSIARSGSASRTSRGVSSWRAAVSTPTFMNCGTNGFMLVVAAVCLDLRPYAAVPGAVEDGLDDAIGTIAVGKRGDGRRQGAVRRSGGNASVDIAHQVAECVGPRLLVPSRQVSVTPPILV